MESPFLAELSPLVIERLGDAYPELREAAPSIRMALELEEERFRGTLSQGLSRFEEVAARVGGGGRIPGDELFLLYDTYGFPTDLTASLARERGLAVDLEGFEGAMEQQRERSRRSARFYRTSGGEELEWAVLSEGPHSVFRGYELLDLPVRIRRYARIPDPASGAPAYWVVLDETPFYAESGGQVGDQGVLEAPGFRARITDTQKREGEIRHRVILEEGSFPEGAVTARVPEGPRWETMRNHTATHLLHAALRSVLGKHVTQAGSLVAPDRLRFDFAHPRAMTPEEIERVEAMVNQQIVLDHPVAVRESSYDEAIRQGVTALFGEKYGERVRRIEVGEFSRELCGGTHVGRTGQIGSFVIVAEGGIAAGTRRIEAVSGLGAVREGRRNATALHKVQRAIPGTAEELPERVQQLQQEIARLRKQVQELRSRGPTDALASLLEKLERIDGTSCLVGELDAEEGTDLRALGDRVRQRLASGAGLVAVHSGAKLTLVAVVTDDLIQKGLLSADALVREAAAAASGSGGGRPHLAMAGVGDPTRVGDALEAGRRKIRAALSPHAIP
jgi:alanyl-tRNA synthetase